LALFSFPFRLVLCTATIEIESEVTKELDEEEARKKRQKVRDKRAKEAKSGGKENGGVSLSSGSGKKTKVKGGLGGLHKNVEITETDRKGKKPERRS